MSSPDGAGTDATGGDARPAPKHEPSPADEVIAPGERVAADEERVAGEPIGTNPGAGDDGDSLAADAAGADDLAADGPTTGTEGVPATVGGMTDTIAALTDDGLDQSQRRWLLGRLAGEIRARGIADLFRPRAAMRWVAEAVSDVAPRLPIRDRETLRRHFPGLSDDALADRLIRNASRTTGAVGAASGGVASIEWVATPALLTAPVLLAAETVAVVAIEIKLIGELHEIYGAPLAGSRTERAVALVTAWARRRGVNPVLPGMGVAAVLGTAARRELGERLLRRFGRNLTTYGPMLTGAAVASYLNRRATVALAQQIRRDLAAAPRPVIAPQPTQPPPAELN